MLLFESLLRTLARPLHLQDEAVDPLLAKRFERRIAELMPAERTEERLNRLFEELTAPSAR
jgi:hypothetical protein